MSHKIPLPSYMEFAISVQSASSVMSLARQYHTSTPTIRKWLAIHQLSVVNKAIERKESLDSFDAQSIKNICAQYVYKKNDIANALNVSLGTLNRRLRQLGLW